MKLRVSKRIMGKRQNDNWNIKFKNSDDKKSFLINNLDIFL